MTIPGGLINPRLGLANVFGLPKQPSDITVVDSVQRPPDIKKAKEQMELAGITREQLEGYTPRLSEAFARHIQPVLYFHHEKDIKEALKSVLFDPNLTSTPASKNPNIIPEDDDAWRLYLGLPQLSKSFGVSDYQPSKSTDNKYYFKLQNGVGALLRSLELRGDAMPEDPKKLVMDKEGSWVPQFRDLVGFLEKQKDWKTVLDDGHALGNYTVSMNVDDRGWYVSYYDKYDFDKYKNAKWLGKPFEIYDRIYFDPDTKEPLTEKVSMERSNARKMGGVDAKGKG